MTGPYPRQDGSPPPGEEEVKVAGRDDDPVPVDEAAATGRPAVLGGLFRTLAEDDERVAYWVRHVRSGVVLSELSAVAAFVYALLTHTPGRHSPFVLAMSAGVVLFSPALLLLPLDRWMRDRRGPLLFYVWSLTVTVVISAAARATKTITLWAMPVNPRDRVTRYKRATSPDHARVVSAMSPGMPRNEFSVPCSKRRYCSWMRVGNSRSMNGPVTSSAMTRQSAASTDPLLRPIGAKARPMIRCTRSSLLACRVSIVPASLPSRSTVARLIVLGSMP